MTLHLQYWQKTGILYSFLKDKVNQNRFLKVDFCYLFQCRMVVSNEEYPAWWYHRAQLHMFYSSRKLVQGPPCTYINKSVHNLTT